MEIRVVGEGWDPGLGLKRCASLLKEAGSNPYLANTYYHGTKDYLTVHVLIYFLWWCCITPNVVVYLKVFGIIRV